MTKKIPLLIFLSLSINSSLLFAQNDNQGTEYSLQAADNSSEALQSDDFSFQIGQRAEASTNYELPTTNCDNSGQDLSCHLMMDPKTAEKGIAALGESLGVFGKSRPLSKLAYADEVQGVDGAQKLSVQELLDTSSTGATKQFAAEVEFGKRSSVSSAQTAAASPSVQQYLEEEICQNIYTSCLAKVAGLSLQESQWAQAGLTLNQAQEREWVAAEKMAIRNKEKAERVFDKARRETKRAEALATEAKKRKEIASKKNNQDFSECIEVIRAEEAANNDYEIKQLVEELEEARLEMACATLMAIEVRSTAQSTAAEAAIDVAKEAEKKALKAFEEAGPRADAAVADLEERIQNITMEKAATEKAEAEKATKIRNAKAAWKELAAADEAYAVAEQNVDYAAEVLSNLISRLEIKQEELDDANELSPYDSRPYHAACAALSPVWDKTSSARRTLLEIAAIAEKAALQSHTLACNTIVDNNLLWKGTADHWLNCAKSLQHYSGSVAGLIRGGDQGRASHQPWRDRKYLETMNQYLGAAYDAAQQAVTARDDIMRAMMKALDEE